MPFAEPGYAFGGNSGVFAESPDRIFILQRGETRLPWPVPDEFAGYAGSIGINVLRDTDRRVWQNCIYTLNGDGEVQERWTQWDYLCEGSFGPGPHRIRINPYDPERSVWVVHETFHQIYVFSNDGSELLMTLGEKEVAGDDETHFGRPQDVAFLPDGRILVADGLDNHRVVILDEHGDYISEFGSFGDGPGQFNGIHALGIGPDGLIFALDRSGGRVNVFRTTDDPAEVEFVDVWGSNMSLTLDVIVGEDHIWLTALGPLRFIKFDFEGNVLYTWLVPPRPPGRVPGGPHLLGRQRRESVRGGQPVRADTEVRPEAGRGSGAAHRHSLGRRERRALSPRAINLVDSLGTWSFTFERLSTGIAIRVPRNAADNEP